MYKIAYIAKKYNSTAFIYNIDNYYVYVVVGEDMTATKPSDPNDNIEYIKSRFRIEDVGKYLDDDETQNRLNISNRQIEMGFDRIQRIIKFLNDEKLSSVGLN